MVYVKSGQCLQERLGDSLQHTPAAAPLSVAQLTLLVLQLSQLRDAGVDEAARISLNTNGAEYLNVSEQKISGGTCTCHVGID